MVDLGGKQGCVVVLFCVFFFQWLYPVTENDYDESLCGGAGSVHVLNLWHVSESLPSFF